MSKAVRILIADDHEIIRKGLRQILQEQYPFAFIDEANDGQELVDKALNALWDVIITDIAMPSMSGLEALKIIKQQVPQVPVLVLSIPPEEQYTVRALKSGASGYLSKDAATEELTTAVDQLLQGRRYIPAHLAADAPDPSAPPNHRPLHAVLTARELEVFLMLGRGLSLTEIAHSLSLETSTISTYRSRILEKMKLNSNADIIRYVVQNKLLS